VQNAKCKRYFIYYTLYLLLFTFYLFHAFASAAEFDTSIDDEIRKKYNPSKIEEDAALPALPKILNGSSNEDNANNVIKATSSSTDNLQQVSYSKTEQSFIRLKKGTKIKLKLLSSVSNGTPKGVKLTFSSIYPVSTTYFTIPSGTIFKGYVVNSHKPQLSGNGGLIVLNINSMIINNEVQPINTNVVKANSKMIFLNNIKGKRKYLQSRCASTKPGYEFCKKRFHVAAIQMQNRSTMILAPLSVASGVLVFGGNVLISPALAMFYKGGNIILHEGCEVDVKLMQDIFVYL